ncbi:hypothetical protein T484DRAFT_1832206 [Baffinella frigidus]|nr:hypothetical protein T484DRAFT_1832206 [Cryptophyta sp. CCMP2293]
MVNPVDNSIKLAKAQVSATGFQPTAVDRSARVINGRILTTEESDMFSARLPPPGGAGRITLVLLAGVMHRGGAGQITLVLPAGPNRGGAGRITLVLPSGVKVGTLRVWNFNKSGLDASRGVRNARVLVGGQVRFTGKP